MKRDLYIVSQVIRTGEYPVSFSLFPFLSLLLSISFIWSQTLPQGIAFLPATASLELLHKCGTASSIPVYKGTGDWEWDKTIPLAPNRAVWKWKWLSMAVFNLICEDSENFGYLSIWLYK